MTKSILYYVHDPMCSWCWGFSNALQELLAALPKSVSVCRVLGGLAPDSDLVMPTELQTQIQASWQRIENTIPGVKFNFDFWKNNVPRRSTYPACRAVIAARKQGAEYDLAMTKAIQKAYYQQARNPSDDETLVELAVEMNLSVDDFRRDLNSAETMQVLHQEIKLARELFAESFPSLVFSCNGENYTINIDYNKSEIMLASILEIIRKNSV